MVRFAAVVIEMIVLAYRNYRFENKTAKGVQIRPLSLSLCIYIRGMLG